MTETQPVALLKPRREVVLIESADALQTAIDELSIQTGALAIDAERASGFKYSQRAYLIQISRRESKLYLIDPVAISAQISPEPFVKLAALLSEDAWILHAATQDLPCLAELGLRPTALFDTELASRILGLERVGLGAVVEHYLHLQLAKEHSAVDWSKRPLDDAWLDYAALDVDVMHELMDGVLGDLEAAGKLDWAQEEFDALLSFKPKGAKPDRWRSTTGLHDVKDARGLAIAREVWQAREDLGRKLDVAPGRLIPDVSISYLAKTQHKSRAVLAADKAFHGRASRNYLDLWWQAVTAGTETNDLPPLKLPHTGIPNHRNWPNKFPRAAARLAVARPLLEELAKEHALPVENLISPDPVRQICWVERSDVDESDLVAELRELGVRDWQIQLTKAALITAIQSADEYLNRQAVEHTEP